MDNLKILVVGGRAKADFLIESLLKKQCEVQIINDDKEFCDYLSQKYMLPIFYGNPAKTFVFDDMNVKNYDVIISLLPNDADNYVVCLIAKELYNIKKTVSIVSNPHNVDIFKKLGISTVISATYTIANIIERESTLTRLSKKLDSHDSAKIREIIVEKNNQLSNKKLKDVYSPEHLIIGAIFRNEKMIVPNGETRILLGDRLVIICNNDDIDAELASWIE